MTTRNTDVLEFLPARKRRALSLAPLIDVTFILLVFFMLVTQFSMLAPVALTFGATPLETLKDTPKGDTPTSLEQRVIVLHADSTMSFNQQKLDDVEGLQSVLETHIQQQAKEVRDTNPNRVVVKPDRDVPLQMLIDVVSALQADPRIQLRIAVPENATQDE